MRDVVSFIEKEKNRFLSELIEFLRIPSISSSPEHQTDMIRCAEFVLQNLKNSGIEDSKIIQTEGHPIVFGQWLGAGKPAPTILIYGHYDVQPVDPLDLWHSNPFDPQIKDGKIWARGTADDKGQVFCHIKAVESLFKTNGKLPVNVKFLIEGEEEAGSSHLDDFIIKNSELLACDTALISDTEWIAPNTPTLCYGLRGLVYFEITVTGPNRDLHSGSFGGAVDNPINVLAWMITQVKDRYGRIRIPGFYDDVLTLTPEERKGFSELPYVEEEYCKDLDIDLVNGEIGYTTFERVWARPSFDLNGIWGGYIGEGAKTVLPSKASAKFSMRLVPNQKADKISKLVEDYFKKLAPPTVKLTFNYVHGGNPVLVPKESAGVRAAIKAFAEAFGKEPVFMREGGSIPIVELFDTVLKAPTVLMGFGLPSDNIHSPNENYELNNFFGGIKTSAIFIEEFKNNL